MIQAASSNSTVTATDHSKSVSTPHDHNPQSSTIAEYHRTLAQMKPSANLLKPFGPGDSNTVEHPVTFMEVVRDQQLEAQQDCTAPGTVGPLGYQQPLRNDPNVPRAEALSPGELQRAAAQQAGQMDMLNFIYGGDPNPDVPDTPDPWTGPQTQIGGPPPAQYPDASGGE